MTAVDAAAWPPGFAIHQRRFSPDPELVDALRGVPTTIVSDCLGRTVGSRGLAPYHGDPTLTLWGVALTVRVRPGDNLLVHKALTLAQPGDVIVVDGSGDVSHALMGGLMRLAAIARGVAGIVIDGAIRDSAEWAQGELPVFARGVSHRGPTKDGPGEINVPIACAGLAVAPADVVVGDADGVMTIAPDRLAALLTDVRQKQLEEAELQARHLAAREDPSLRVLDDERVDALLRARGCPV
ncbi:MAG: RraA family protein [Thermoleophilia bacterium]|nr:RraA family protein [Thermoleophilia bacterium]